MILSFLLWLAAWRIRLKLFFVYKKFPDIREELVKESFSMQIQTLDKKNLRCFVLKHAIFKSFTAEMESPSIKIIFPDAKVAREVFKAVRKDKSQIFTFIQEQKVSIEGDFTTLQKLFLLKERIDGPSEAA
jgi:hypothetical protein